MQFESSTCLDPYPPPCLDGAAHNWLNLLHHRVGHMYCTLIFPSITMYILPWNSALLCSFPKFIRRARPCTVLINQCKSGTQQWHLKGCFKIIHNGRGRGVPKNSLFGRNLTFFCPQFSMHLSCLSQCSKVPSTFLCSSMQFSLPLPDPCRSNLYLSLPCHCLV